MKCQLNARPIVSFFTVILMSLGAASLSMSALAQDQDQDDSSKADQGVLEEVIVTARFREEKLQNTPIAITALSAGEIQARGFKDSYEVAYTVPNASFRPAQAAYGNTMTAYIRGIGQYDFDFAFEPGVGIYVDDVYQPFLLGSQLDLVNAERVEVLRGPQGTLFGRGSIGGVVRLISHKPEPGNAGNVDIIYGDFNRIDLRALYDFSLTDNLIASISAASRQRDGYQDVVDFACRFPDLAGTLPVRDPSRGRNCVTGTQGGEKNASVRGQLRWIISDKAELLLAGDYFKDTSEPRADTLLAIQYQQDLSGNVIPTSGYKLWDDEYAAHVPTPDEPWGYGVHYDNRFIPPNWYQTYATYNDPASGLTFKPEAGLERSSVSGTLNWHLTDNVALTAVLAYTDITSDLVSDADASPLNLQVTGGQQTLNWTQAEVRLNGLAMENKLDWTVGLFYYTGSVANRQAVSFPPIFWGIFRPGGVGAPPGVVAGLVDGPVNIGVNAQNLADVESKAAFAHVVYNISDRWSVNAGLRYSDDSKDVNFDNSFVQSKFKITDNHTDWRLGVDFNASDNVMLYASAATGYRPPAYNPRPFTPAQAGPVGGEEATAYELGVKSDLFDHTLRANVAVFYTDYNKRIVPIGGTECVSDPVDPSTPGAIIDSAGNVCLATTSLTSYQQLTGGEIKGAELELTWVPIEALTISGIYGYTDWSSPEIDNCDFNQDGMPDTGVTCSNRPTFVPQDNWSITASYDFAMASGARLTPRVDVYGQTEICSSVVSQLSCAPGYELVNARLEWMSADGDWSFAGGVTNLNDKEYLLNIFDLTLFGQNTVEGQPGRPREWYFEFNRRF